MRQVTQREREQVHRSFAMPFEFLLSVRCFFCLTSGQASDGFFFINGYHRAAKLTQFLNHTISAGGFKFAWPTVTVRNKAGMLFWPFSRFIFAHCKRHLSLGKTFSMWLPSYPLPMSRHGLHQKTFLIQLYSVLSPQLKYCQNEISSKMFTHIIFFNNVIGSLLPLQWIIFNACLWSIFWSPQRNFQRSKFEGKIHSQACGCVVFPKICAFSSVHTKFYSLFQCIGDTVINMCSRLSVSNGTRAWNRANF